jgi:CRISPR/Cas system-associated endonuclease Cas3-HD
MHPARRRDLRQSKLPRNRLPHPSLTAEQVDAQLARRECYKMNVDEAIPTAQRPQNERGKNPSEHASKGIA